MAYRLLVPALLLTSFPSAAFTIGASYQSGWSTFQLKHGIEVDSAYDAAPYHSGFFRLNQVTLHDRSGFLRAAAIAAGSVSEEVQRRDAEAESSGGYYHRGSPAMPGVVAGGEARVSVWWGSEGPWSHFSIGYLDGLDPKELGLGFLWTIEAEVRLGFTKNAAFTTYRDEGEGEMFLRLLNVGPTLIWTPGKLGALVPVLKAGVRLDPIFKPITGLIFEGHAMLDLHAFARAEFYLTQFLLVGAELSHDRGFTSYPSEATTLAARAGLMF